MKRTALALALGFSVGLIGQVFAEGRGFPRGGGGASPNFSGSTGTYSGTVTAEKFTATGVVSFESGLNGRIYYGGAGGHYITSNGATGTALSTGGYSGGPYYNGAGALGGLMDSPTAPTVANGCTGEAVSWHNGSANFRFGVGTSCAGVQSMTITLPATSNCWTCHCWNVTAQTELKQSACTTTTATITNMGTTVNTPADWNDSTDVQCACRGG